jgi:hypothetical protein
MGRATAAVKHVKSRQSLTLMPLNAAVAEVAWDPRASIALKERPEIGRARLGRRSKVDAPAPETYVASAAVALLDTGINGRVSPRVFAGFVRFGEFVLLAGLGFLIAYFYVAEFFRQYAAALALTGLSSITVFQALGLYSIPAFSTAHRQLPRLLMAGRQRWACCWRRCSS